MINRFSFALAVMTCVISLAVRAELRSAGKDSREISKRNEETVLTQIRSNLRGQKKSVRLYYEAQCHNDGEAPVPFPSTKVQSAKNHNSDVAKVRESFMDNRNVTVNEEQPGIVAIRIGKVQAKILQIRLRSVKLEPLEQYNATEAIGAIENSKEFQDAARSLEINPVWSYSALATPPAEELPHLPATITDMTVNDALDLIAKTFKGIVLYGECADGTRKRSIWIDFAPIEIP